MKKKKGVSPVVATVLLIAMVVVIVLIIYFWFRGIGGEVITKFDTNVELVCGDVEFYSDYDDVSTTLSVSNLGNVPIYGMKVKKVDGGEHTTDDIRTLGGWPSMGLGQGGSYSGNVNLGGYERVILTPILLGTSDKGERAYMCDEDQHGYEVVSL